VVTELEVGRRTNVERRLWAFHEVSIADVLQVIDYLREPGDSVIAGGSLTFGLGNRLSDFDVVICGRTTDSSLMPLQHWVDSLRVDVWTRTHDDVDRLFAEADTALAASGPIAGELGSVEEEQQLKLLHRVAFGLYLDGPPLTPSTRDHAEVARDLIVREYAERMRESACVAQLAVRAERWLAAATNARSAVEEALHAVLAAHGVPFTGDKWLQEQLKRQAPQLHSRYENYAVLPEDDGCEEFVIGAVAWCQQLTGLDLEVEECAPELRWVDWGLRLHRVSGDNLLVAPEIGGLWRLAPGEVGAWQGLARIAEEEDAGHVAWPGDRCGQAEMNLCLRLYERGLVQLVWNRGVPLSDLAISEVADW
jgi:hypothetical protein